MTFDMKLVVKGLHEPLDGVLSQARYLAALAKQYATELAQKQWSADDTTRLLSQAEAVDTAKSHQLDERTGALGDTAAQGRLVSESKTLIQKLRLALPLVLEDHGAELPEITKQTFAAPGGQLGRSPSDISAYLNKIGPPVKQLDPYLAPYFDGATVSEQVAARKAALDEAVAMQDLSEANLPDEALAVQEQKGRVLKLIARLNAIGQLRFHGDAAMSGKFNRDLLLAARKKRKSAPKTGGES